jgi:hypothetical protein
VAQPNFVIIGAAKAATTSLSSLLDAHPQVSLGLVKESHFFSYDERYRLGWEQYLRLYESCGDRKAIGDGSTSYSRLRYHPNVIARMRHHLGAPRVLYMVREPCERMVSAYIEHCCTPERTPYRSINEAVLSQPMIIDSSRYWEVFDAYRLAFGEERIKIVWFEEYVADKAAVFGAVCRFLGIDEACGPALTHERQNGRREASARLLKIGRGDLRLNTTWDDAVRRMVQERIRDDNARFLRHFGRPADFWGNRG